MAAASVGLAVRMMRRFVRKEWNGRWCGGEVVVVGMVEVETEREGKGDVGGLCAERTGDSEMGQGEVGYMLKLTLGRW